MSEENFLKYLAELLNKTFSTDSFKLVNEGPIQIYSEEFNVGLHSMVSNPDNAQDVSFKDLISRIEYLVVLLKLNKWIMNKLIIVSTNNEEAFVRDYIELLRKHLKFPTDIEFWGWETIRKLLDNFPMRNIDPVIDPDTVYLNFVPTANIYQLFGIENLLATIDEKIDSALTPVVLHNPISGTGKTAAALAYVYHYDYQKKFDHYAYVQVDTDIKLNFIIAFDQRLGFEYKPVWGLKENFNLLLDILSRVPGRNLLIIDGVREISDTSTVLEIKEKLNWKIIVVSAFRIYGFENIYIDHPLPEVAQKIFIYFFKKLTFTNILEDLLDRIYYHPFTTVFFAKTLSHFYGELTLQELNAISEEMEGRVFRLGVYIPKDLTKTQIVIIRTILKNIMAVFDFQARRFTSVEKKILTLAAVLPRKYMSFSFLKNVIDEDENRFNDAVLLLLSKGWLDADKDKFRVPPFIKAVLHKKLKPSPSNLHDYIVFLEKKLKDIGSPEAIQWIDHAVNVIDALRTADVHVANLVISVARNYEALKEFEKARKYYKLSGYLMEVIYKATNDFKILEVLVGIWAKAEDYDRALFFANHILERIELENEKIDQEKILNWYRIISELYMRTDNYEKAIELADNALDMAMMIYDRSDDRLKEIVSFHKRLSTEFNNKIKSQEKIQWLKRFFL